MTYLALAVLFSAAAADTVPASTDTIPAAGTVPAAADTIPSPRRQPEEHRQARTLPTGLSFEEMRRALERLRPVEQPRDPRRPGGPDGNLYREIDGLVVDETQSKIGRDFYQVFFASWEAPPEAHNFTIRVQEQPSPSLGTRIVVLLDDEMLFQLQLQPRYEVVEELAQQAALYTRRELERRQPEALPAAAGDPDAEGPPPQQTPPPEQP